MIFDATGSPGTSTVDILPSFGAFETKVWDNEALFCDGVVVPSQIGQSADVTIIQCSSDGECDDGNGCTDDSCSVGVCEHVGNFDDTQVCCDPADGSLESLFDGNVCTGFNGSTAGLCDPLTGQVTHFPLPGASCGDQTSSTCTNPDTCDAAGNCLPNHANDGNFCEADGDTCTRDHCASGECVYTGQNEEIGTPCDDGQDNCTPGQDTCLEGVCFGGGSNPCAAQPGDYCLEIEEVGPPCPGGDSDCSGFPGSTCDGAAEPFCRRAYTCGECRPGMDDCPDDGDCLVLGCSLNGACVGPFLDDDLCQDGLYCNGAEQCQGIGSPPDFGQCVPDPLPPCKGGLVCREETCCVNDVCSEDSCECVMCLNDIDCDDFSPCNGLELCDQVDFTCVPGVPIDCSHLNGECTVGECNAALPGPDFCETVPAFDGFACDDGEPCTILDTCTAEGLCVGSQESPDGTVDLQWSPTTGNLGIGDHDIGEIVRVDIWAVADDGDVCSISGEPCVSNSDCPGLCDDGFTTCSIPNDCTGIGSGFCNSFVQSCAPGEHGVTIITAVIEFDPAVLELIVGGNPPNPHDPCDADGTPGDCVDCTDDSDCAALGVSCYCPGGPPCGDQPGEALGVCQTGKYAWGASGFPDGGLDPDNLNSTWTDGQAFYNATARIGVITPKPKAPILSSEPLWITSLEFLALSPAASTTVSFNRCAASDDTPTRTRIIEGAGYYILGDLGQVSLTIRECEFDSDCDDGVPCTDDSCDGDSQCQYLPNDEFCANALFCDGVEFCDALLGCQSPGDPCIGQGLFCLTSPLPGMCVECLQNADCDDQIVCTVDSCVDNVCINLDDCPDDNKFCNGLEFCNLDTNTCDSTGDPCPGKCTEQDECPSCDPPLVESVGPRFIAITPQPRVNPAPTAFLVTSDDWPCLNKYVGTFARCGGADGICNVDADCNSCTLLNSACLTDDDCKTCQGGTNPCQDDADCGGPACVSVQVCQLSGQTCDPGSFFDEIDIDDDGLPDGILATLVSDPADRAILTAEEWGTTAYPRCSHSQDPCETAADCDIGVCSFSGAGCSVSADNCRGLCAITQLECQGDQECPTAGDACTGTQTCATFETCEAGKIYVISPDIVPTDIDKLTDTLFPISYNVRADCGSFSDPVLVVMRLWADADDNGLVNINDAQLTILGFQGSYLPSVPSRTKVAFDIDGLSCTPNLEVNINDVFKVILAFQGGRFDPDVVGSSTSCSLPSCP